MPPEPNPFRTEGEENSSIVRSRDPNDKLGPSGYGSAGYLPAGGVMAYQIRFENQPSATAPAQRVTVTDTLDPNLDLSTFELTEIAFANQTLAIPAGLNHYETHLAFKVTNQTLIPLGEVSSASVTNAFVVEVSATVDPDTRLLSLSLIALDPLTGWYPEDPLVGLLYPNDDTRRGEGSVSFLVRPKLDLPTGTRIENRARIVFDYSDPIDTPLVFNTIDAAPPSSAVNPLTANTDSPDVAVSWAGADDSGGVGVASFDIYVSEDGAPPRLWIEPTKESGAIFPAAAGHAYAFYSVARDNVGHVEAPPATPDASTFVTSPFTLNLTVDGLSQTAEVGTDFAYGVVIANQGPSAASDVVLTHSLHPGLDVVSATLTQGTVNAAQGLLSANIGALPGGSQARLDVVMKALESGTFETLVTVVSGQRVRATTNVVVTVLPVQPTLGARFEGDFLTLNWPASGSAFVLQQTDSLSPPVEWRPVTGATVVIGGEYSFSAPTTNTARFYRLWRQP